ncbi:MAG TPA: prepilin peptidase [Bdellovibrionales bacterium]|nr:MAG: hypothetical protein A2X97_07735 [Bdellovibrionales bacterium GWA1_52_35]OFZ35685.1 MAG: hypothetical protein A2070_15355 [Bdellovibrionales bacterium GWC1_52_8]HAR41578.1 prepilin peptidase [Bdellovibrionales bacterium]HCM41390.1 prepilin peptidase [Bdellovibrionales bacterium]
MQLYPTWFLYLATVLSGLLIGSFVNVLVVRLPHDLSVVRPRSRCPECEALIHWYDNIPVLSFLLLRGKCRNCGKPISARYPVIELLTMLLFLAAHVRFGWSPLLFVRDWPFLAILVAITFIDLEHRIIPDVLSLGGMALGLLTSFLMPSGFWVVSISGAALGFGSFYLLAWVYEKFTGRMGMGGGDIKLLGMLGAFLGPQGVIASILISSVLGSLVGIGWALAKGEKEIMKTSIPYGPFLVIGGLYYYLLGDILWFQFMTQT